MAQIRKLLSLLESCKTQKKLLQIQSQVVARGLQQDGYVGRSMVAACCRITRIGYTRQVFDGIYLPHISIWNSMFSGYDKKKFPKKVLSLYKRMRSMDVMPDWFTLPIVLNACVMVKDFRLGEEIHCISIKTGLGANSFVGTKLVGLYSCSGEIGSARDVFCEMSGRNVVTWTAMIKGFLSKNDLDSALHLFDLSPDKDLVLWNTMIKAYARNERYSEVLTFFQRMQDGKNVVPDEMTITMVLSACAKSGSYDLGKKVHKYAEKVGFNAVDIVNASMTMHAKCGAVDIAYEIFKGMKTRDVVSWNTIINALATHGYGTDALELFEEMRNTRIKPNSVTFIGVLLGYAHMGLVEEGLVFFNNMHKTFSFAPQKEHYGCVVNLLCKNGLLDNALDFIGTMPLKADAIIWTTVLGASKEHNKVEVGERALQELIKVEPRNPSHYLLLSQLYAEAGRFDDAQRLKNAMRNTGFKKDAGVSRIETNGNESL